MVIIGDEGSVICIRVKGDAGEGVSVGKGDDVVEDRFEVAILGKFRFVGKRVLNISSGMF